MLADLSGHLLKLQEAHRFPNVPVTLPTGLYWNTPVSYTHLDVYKRQVPILDVARPVLFGIKVGGTVALINATGLFVYRRAGR